MLKRGWLYSIAFVIYLIITWPIYGSVVYADILHADVFGNNGVSGFRKVNDDTIITMNVTPLTGEPAVVES